MTDPERVDLAQPRTLGPILGDSLRIYRRHFLLFLVVGLAIATPAELIVAGIGLGELTSNVDETPSVGVTLAPLIVRALVTTPLITVIVLYVLQDLAAGERPRPLQVIQRGLDIFRPVFLPVAMGIGVEALITAALVVPLALVANSALVPTLLIPIVLAVRWYFVPQAVVQDGARGRAALGASWELTRGSGWRVAGILLVAFVVLGVGAGLVATPVVAAARAADSGALYVLSGIVSEALQSPALALVSALLYFDLKSRRAA